MRGEEFSFNLGGLEVGAAFAQRCATDRNRPQAFAIRPPSLTFQECRKWRGFVSFADMRYDCVCILYGTRNMVFSFSSAPFFLANGLVGGVLLGSFQACAICIPAAPVRGFLVLTKKHPAPKERGKLSR